MRHQDLGQRIGSANFHRSKAESSLRCLPPPSTLRHHWLETSQATDEQRVVQMTRGDGGHPLPKLRSDELRPLGLWKRAPLQTQQNRSLHGHPEVDIGHLLLRLHAAGQERHQLPKAGRLYVLGLEQHLDLLTAEHLLPIVSAWRPNEHRLQSASSHLSPQLCGLVL